MSRFLSPTLEAVTPYTPGEQPQDQQYIKLNTNESPYLPSPAVVGAVSEAEVEKLRLYSDPACAELLRAAAAHFELQPEQIMPGNGSDENLFFALRAFCDENHPLASVHGSFNAVFVKAEAADDLMFYGRGAGGAPTASAVVGDVVTEARHIAAGCTGPSIPLYKNLPKAPITASKAAFAVRFLIHDKPGVLAAIAAEFAKNGVSINGVNQDLKPTMTDPGYDGEIQQLRVVTHLTDEETLRNTVKAVQALDFVTGDPSILRVLD